MIDTVRNVAILGASGSIGSLVGGIIAQEGIKVYFLSRTLAGAKRGLEKAIAQARSEVIGRNIVCGDYDHLLQDALREADWIIESVTEDLATKRRMYDRIDQRKRPDAVVSSTTSSLLLKSLSQGSSENFKENFLSTHFYNPPSRMRACEIAAGSDTDPEVFGFMKGFLEHRLRRVVIPVRDVAGFAGNRIAFLLLNRIATLAEEHGVQMMDYLIGPYTGRVMAPLATLDLVGLDIYRAIIESLYENTDDEMHDCFVLPDYVERMIQNGALGDKTPSKGGFYSKDVDGNCLCFAPASLGYVPSKRPNVEFVEAAKDMIHLGRYREAFDIVKSARGQEANIVMDILCTYIAYAHARAGEVTDAESGMDGIDKVMSYGYNWASPSLMVNMLGGRDRVTDLLAEKGFEAPDFLAKADKYESLTQVVGHGKYFLAR